MKDANDRRRALALAMALTLAPSWAAGAIITTGAFTTPTPATFGTSDDGPGLDLGGLFPGVPVLLEPWSVTGVTRAIVYLRDEMSRYADRNVLGWIDLDTGYSELIFHGSDSRGTIRVLTLPARWALWLESPHGRVQSDEGRAFALLAYRPNHYILGVEDKASDWDHNDLVVDLLMREQPPVSAVPEPATLALVGAGLFAAGWRKRARTRKRPTPGALADAQRAQDHFFDWGVTR